MITINKQPKTVSLLKQIEFEFESDNMYSPAGTVATLELTFASIAAAGETIVFSDGTTLTGSNTPNDSGLEFDTSAPGLASFVEGVYICILSNYPLGVIYDISYTLSTVTLTAKRKSADDSITLSGGTFAGVSGSATAGVDETIRPFFSLFAQLIYKPKGSSSYSSFEEQADFSPDQLATYNPSALLSSFEDSFLFPAASGLTNRNSALMQYYLRYAESFGSPPVVQAIHNTSVAYALPGNISDKLQQYFEEKNLSFWDNQVMLREFLTLHTAAKETELGELQKLYYLVTLDTTASIDAYVLLRYDDGSTGGVKLASAAAVRYDLFELNFNTSDISLSGNLVQYELYIVENTAAGLGAASKHMIFDIDYRNYQKPRYYIFRNSYGVYETIRILDRAQEYAKIDSSLVETDLFDSYRNRKTRTMLEGVQYSTRIATTYLKNKETIPFYLSFLASEDAYEIIDSRLYPITIDTQKLLLDDDDLSRFKFRFTYYRQADSTPYIYLPTPQFTFAFSNAFKIN